MWIILATTFLLFYVSSRAEACDLYALRTCLSIVPFPGEIIDESCTCWQSRIDCYMKADCLGDEGYIEDISLLEENCHYGKGTIDQRWSCDKRGLLWCKGKYYASDNCKFWNVNRGCYWMSACADEKDYGKVISGLRNCHKEPVTTEQTSGCDREALSNCIKKTDIGDKCKYWQSTHECYTMEDCSGEKYKDKVNSEIQKHCYDEPATTEQTTDTTTEQTSGCNREALSKCIGKKDNSDECKSAKGRLECYTEENCFDDNYKHDDMEKEKQKACDCTCKMRSSCLVLVVMLALIKYLD